MHGFTPHHFCVITRRIGTYAKLVYGRCGCLFIVCGSCIAMPHKRK
jgi:hypothetical protein